MKTMHSICLLVGTCALVGATHAANLVGNPDFDSGLEGWTLASASGPGTFTVDTATGAPSAPSIHLVPDPATAFGIAVQSNCIAIDTSQNVDLLFNMKATSGWGYANVDAYSDASCGTLLSALGTPAYGANGQWGPYSLPNAALPAGTHSARVVLVSSMGSLGSPGDAHFDHIAFGPTGSTPVTLQTFDID